MTKQEQWDPVWEKIYIEHEWGKYPAEDLIRFIARNFYKVSNRQSIKILEVGCGPGGNLWFIAREGFQTFGIDGSKTAIAKAKKRLDSELPNWSGNLLVGDISKLPFTDFEFDAVIDSEALYCNSLEKTKSIISEIYRVLKPSGLFFSRTFASGSYGDKTGVKVSEDMWITSEGSLAGKGPSRFTRKEQIKELYSDFKLEEVELIQRTIGGPESNCTIKEWVISARKP